MSFKMNSSWEYEYTSWVATENVRIVECADRATTLSMSDGTTKHNEHHVATSPRVHVQRTLTEFDTITERIHVSTVCWHCRLAHCVATAQLGQRIVWSSKRLTTRVWVGHRYGRYGHTTTIADVTTSKEEDVYQLARWRDDYPQSMMIPNDI